MRSKNNVNYDQEKLQNIRYTIIATLCVMLAVGIVAYTAQVYPGWMVGDEQTPIDMADKGVDEKEPPSVGASQNVPTVDSLKNRDEKDGVGGKENYGFIMPAEGEILKHYSPEAPLYSKTLDQYVTHDGVDIESSADAQVKAIADGTVTKVRKDDGLGIIIEIDHGDGFISRYANLSTDQMVEENDVVKQGDVISGIGSSALFESLDPTHLHFELVKDGEYVDPAKYL